ncbi:phage tail protein [Coleofasciculus sp. FACHB-129]|uniref:phage tail protein n=1 Tax=Cyanophyceae TaxID=3028117 RepID=UPI001685F8DA|nr:phage tail protein [Coleofasciculus sp. FACHB-129]MBD1897107.1 phage tail protein [Coleofasciculus sp. FACHB-129]
MTQSTSHGKILHLTLTPMQLAEAVQPVGASSTANALALSGSVSTEGMTSNQLLVYPGEPSEMVVQLKNLGTRILQVNLQLEGNFPSQWYRIGMEGHEIAPGQQMDAVLYFQIPANFFENNQSLESGKTLVVDYHSRLYVYYTELGGTGGIATPGRQLIESAAFNLYIRPRSLYLDFLPSLYREVDFIGRFLKIFEETFEPTVQSMDLLWAYLDPLTAPTTMLPFLAHWVAWPMDPRWSLNRQRYLIRQAVELYRWRGTRRGLRLYLHLYTDLPLDEHLPEEADKHISIEEIFGQGFLLGETRLGEDSMLGGGRPYHFIVHLRPERPGQVDEGLVRHIIDQEKPAFCTYDLDITEVIGIG